MKLYFLGQSYEPSFPTVEVRETNLNLTFLGRRHAQKQPHSHYRHQPASDLTYRGVRYSA